MRRNNGAILYMGKKRIIKKTGDVIDSEIKTNKFGLKDSFAKNTLREAAINITILKSGLPRQVVAPIVDSIIS